MYTGRLSAVHLGKLTLHGLLTHTLEHGGVFSFTGSPLNPSNRYKDGNHPVRQTLKRSSVQSAMENIRNCCFCTLVVACDCSNNNCLCIEEVDHIIDPIIFFFFDLFFSGSEQFALADCWDKTILAETLE